MSATRARHVQRHRRPQIRRRRRLVNELREMGYEVTPVRFQRDENRIAPFAVREIRID